MLFKEKLHSFQERSFDIAFIMIYILMFISALGISDKPAKYIEQINYYIRIYICLFLIWRFNPFRTHYEFTKLDAKISFAAGFLILSTTILEEYYTGFKNIIFNNAF